MLCLTAYRCWEHRLARTDQETLTDDHIFIHWHEEAEVWDWLYFGTPIPTAVKEGFGNCQ